MQWKIVGRVCVCVDLTFLQHLSCLTGSPFFPLMYPFLSCNYVFNSLVFYSRVRAHLFFFLFLACQHNAMRALALNIIWMGKNNAPKPIKCTSIDFMPMEMTSIAAWKMCSLECLLFQFTLLAAQTAVVVAVEVVDALFFILRPVFLLLHSNR